jgi:predicted ABC-type ATPase
MDHPHAVMIGGPNGAGQSTVAPLLLRDTLRVCEFVDADVIARGLAAFDATGAALLAGRTMLERVRDLAARRRDFAFESTMASRSFAPWLRALTSEGYLVHVFFVWIGGVDAALERVRSRALSGGHDVPSDTIRRRFGRSRRNFLELYRPLAYSWHVYDNSTCQGPRLVARGDVDEAERVFRPTVWDAVRRDR